MSMKEQFNAEIAEGNRFEFGENWSRFLRILDDNRIHEAEKSLVNMLGLDASGLTDRTFLDVGNGSGLFSLAARRLGAKVYSFDYDPQSVACAQELKNRYFPSDTMWHIEQGSVLDTDYLQSLGAFDYVYSWGVLHHTGDMWQALKNVEPLVGDNGFLFIAIYNDQGWKSKYWLWVKKTYNHLPNWLRIPFTVLTRGPFELRSFLRYAMQLKPQVYFESWRNYSSQRGMNRWTDLIDWMGGYPFEVARPEQIIQFYEKKGYMLVNQFLRNGLGCNEFVFRKIGFLSSAVDDAQNQ